MRIDRRTLMALGGASVLAAASGARAQTVLRFSHADAPAGPRHKSAEFFARKVEDYTQGRYKVEVFHSGRLADDPGAVEQLRLGGIDFTVTGTGTYAAHVKPLGLTALPFLVEDYEQGWKLYDESPWLQMQFARLQAEGLRVLAIWEAGFRSFTTTMALSSPEDAKGKRMRASPGDMMRWTLEAIGFSPVVLPETEVYRAIQQGAVTGQENLLETIYAQRFYEVAPFVTLTQHVYCPVPLAVSGRTWQRLSEADRAAVTKAAGEAAEFCRKEVRSADDQQVKEMTAKGAKLSRPSIEPFRSAVKPVYDKAREIYGRDLDEVLAAAEQIRKNAATR